MDVGRCKRWGGKACVWNGDGVGPECNGGLDLEDGLSRLCYRIDGSFSYISNERGD